MNLPTKIAIIGIGRWGKNLVKEFDKQANIAYCFDNGNIENKKWLNENYPKIRTTTSLEDILNDSSVDAMVVATPTTTHFEIAQKILKSKKHLFLEKPGCSNSEQFKELHNEAKKENLVFVIGYEFAHHRVLQKIKELIKIDDIKTIHFEWKKWGTFEDPIIPHLLSHDISIIKSLGIEITNIKNLYKQKVISDADIIKIEFENNKNIYITSLISRISINKNKNVTFIGTKYSYIWNNDDLFEINTDKKTNTLIDTGTTSPVSEEIRNFLESIEKIKKPLTSSEFASDIWNILEKIDN